MERDIFSVDASDITAEACAWIAQLETGELSAADQDAFREWIGRSPRHAAEIRYQARMSAELNVLSGMSQSINEAAETYRGIVSRSRSRTIFPGKALLASLVCAILVVALVMQSEDQRPEVMLYATAVGEHRDITLSDGSVVSLNTDSQIEVTFDKYNRKVRLLSGEAFFDVMPNANRPFWVHAHDQYVRVVGTAFLVSLIDKEFELMVTEGRVELAKEATLPVDTAALSNDRLADSQGTDQLSTTPLALTAGQGVKVVESRFVDPVHLFSERDQKRELSWQEGLHDFSNTPLEEVVNELSRYSDLTIEITDPDLREIKFGGVFRIGDTEPLFDALETAYGVRVTYLDENSVSLSLL